MNREGIVKSMEFVGALGFLLCYKMFDIRLATMFLVASLTFGVVLAWLLKVGPGKLQLVVWLMASVLGIGSLAFNDDIYIKWKPTVTNLVIGTAFLVSMFLGKESLCERFIKDHIPAPAQRLRRVNVFCILYFFVVAGLNLVVAYQFSTDVWVNFKFFGLTALHMMFVVGCVLFLKDYLPKEKPKR